MRVHLIIFPHLEFLKSGQIGGVKARMRLKGMQVSDDKTKISTGWNIADLNTY